MHYKRHTWYWKSRCPVANKYREWYKSLKYSYQKNQQLFVHVPTIEYIDFATNINSKHCSICVSICSHLGYKTWVYLHFFNETLIWLWLFHPIWVNAYHRPITSVAHMENLTNSASLEAFHSYRSTCSEGPIPLTATCFQFQMWFHFICYEKHTSTPQSDKKKKDKERNKYINKTLLITS